MSGTGFLQLGTAISGAIVVPPPSGTNYVPQPVSFTSQVGGGILLNDVNCVFGPVSGSWGTLTTFGVTDGSGNPLVTPGTLQVPFTPLNGQLVVVPPGNISIVVGAQFAAGPGAFVSRSVSGPTTSGSVALSSGAYTLVVASGSYNTLSVQNQSNADVVGLRVGDATQPASGAAPTVRLPPLGMWPTEGGAFIPAGPVWGIAGLVSGTVAGWLTG